MSPRRSFGPLLKPLVSQFPGAADNPYTFLVPGLLVQAVILVALGWRSACVARPPASSWA